MQLRLVHGPPSKPFTEGILLESGPADYSLHSPEESAYISKKFEKNGLAVLKTWPMLTVVVKSLQNEKDASANLEKIRRSAAEIQEILAREEATFTRIIDHQEDKAITLAFLEGLFLSGYLFQKYKAEKKRHALEAIEIYSDHLSQSDLDELTNRCEIVFKVRDLVNEPLISLTAEDLAKQVFLMGMEKGFSVQILDKAAINELKMGGLLAINAGSPNSPTFTVIEHKPEHAVNSKPLVLVGKGVVYDTGGLSLKPTLNSMDFMKCDMAGAAVVAGVVAMAASQKWPVHVIGLLPATENRPDGNAITPGDVVTMHNGMTVEIMNTDAEGRIILADALSYARQFDPELVIDIATLTGNAVAAIGNKGIVYMGTADKAVKTTLEHASYVVHERLVEFPLWEEFGAYLDSDIADMRNIGGSDSGAICGGKFLERFVTFPWLHLDIAGMAYSLQKDSYRGKGASGAGVRLLSQFIKEHYLQNG